MNSLPKTVTRQRRGFDLNPCPSAFESSTLTTRRTHSLSRLAWSEPLRVGGQPALSLHSSDEPGELSQ